MLNIEFYKSYYADLCDKNNEQLEQHWEEYGKSEGRFEDPYIALNQLLQDPRLPADFDIISYLHLNPDVASSIRWSFEGYLHYLRSGNQEGRQYKYKSTNIAINTKALKINNRQSSMIFANSSEFQALPISFNLSSYLAYNPDIREATNSGPEAIEHFIKYGQHEDRVYTPRRFSPRFIKQLYNLVVPQGITLDKLPDYVRKNKNFSFTDILFFYEAEMFQYYNIELPYLSEFFDHEYYSAKYLREVEGSTNRVQCLLHFCEVGQHHAHDIASNLLLDSRFYEAEYHTDLSSNQDFFRDWMRSKPDNIRWPNLPSLIKANFNLDVPAHLLNLAVHKAYTSGARLKPSEYVARIIEEPLLDAVIFENRDTEMALFYTDLANRLVQQKKEGDAARLYDFVLRLVPKFSPALTNRAVLAERHGDIGHAIAIRKHLIEMLGASASTFVDLANCYRHVNDEISALQTLTEGVHQFPNDVGLRNMLKACRARYFESLWQASTGIALSYDYATAQKLVREAADLCSDAVALPVVSREIRTIAIYANCDLLQCKFYRVDQKAEQLTAAGYQVRVYNYVTETERYFSDLSEIDFVIVYRVPAFPYVIQAIQKTTALGIVTLYDVDDLVFDPVHFPPPLPSYAGQISEAEHASMACGVSLFAHAMSLCQYGMASTQSLIPFVQANVAGKQTFFHPNGLSLEHQVARNAKTSKLPGKTTIFYGSGTKAHKADFTDLVEPALLRLFEVHGDCIHVIVVGDLAVSPTLTSWRHAITVYKPLRDIQTYWDLLKLSDINISVIEQNVFNDCKSEIKWLEAANFGIPSVVSTTATYEEIIVPGETGFLYDNTDTLFQHLDNLVRSPDLRQTIGRKAAQRSNDAYNIQVLSRNLRSIIETASLASQRATKRLTIVNVFYPPQSIGGATRVVHDNVLDLKRILGPDWQIDVICTREGGLTPYEVDWYEQDNIRIFCITAADNPRIDQITEDPIMARAFGSVLDTIKPDVVHFHCIQRLTASCLGEAQKRGIPFAVTMHDGWWISPHQFLLDEDNKVFTYDFNSLMPSVNMAPEDFERSRILKRYLTGAERLLTVSKPFAELCRRTGLDNIEVVENGVSRLPMATARLQSTGRVRLALIGGLAAHKGYNLLRNIFQTERFQNLSLLLIDHAMQPGITLEQDWNGTPVEFRGKFAQSRIVELYNTIDVLLAPSIWPESYGLVSREALAMGRWVIASNRGAIAECVIDKQNGYIVDVTTPEGLIRALRYVDAHPETHKQSPATKTAIRTAAQQAEELAALYETIYEKHHARSTEQHLQAPRLLVTSALTQTDG